MTCALGCTNRRTVPVLTDCTGPVHACRLYASLGWSHWEAQERALQAVRFPKDLALM